MKTCSGHKAVNHAGWEIQEYGMIIHPVVGWKAVTGPLPTVIAAEKLASMIRQVTPLIRMQESLLEKSHGT